jgi:hypothetical protein
MNGQVSGTQTQTAGSPAATPGPAAGTPAATPAPTTNVADPTQGGKTLPIGGADGSAVSLYKPDGIGDHLIGQTNEETIDRLFKENAGFRQSQATKGATLVSKVEDVKFDWSDKVKGQGGIASDDKALSLFSEIAVKHKFDQQQLAAIPAFFDAAIDAGLIEPPYSQAKVLEGLAPADFRGTPQERQLRGGERLVQAENWIKQLPLQSGYDDAVKNELRLLTTSVDGVRALEIMMKGGMNASFSAGAGQQTPDVTKQDYERRVADPRYWSHNPAYDENFAKETAEMAKKVFGT